MGGTHGEPAGNVSHGPPAARQLALDTFPRETLEEAVSSGAINHVQLRWGRFLGELLDADLDELVFDYAAYNAFPAFSQGMPSERIVPCIGASDGGERISTGHR